MSPSTTVPVKKPRFNPASRTKRNERVCEPRFPTTCFSSLPVQGEGEGEGSIHAVPYLHSFRTGNCVPHLLRPAYHSDRFACCQNERTRRGRRRMRRSARRA